MKFGVREICDVVFKANADVKIGNIEFKRGQPVLYIDTAKTSTIEGAASTVYATGGRGNSRLIAWEGEKTLTFTVEDALLSPIGFAVLSGAGIFEAASNKKAMVHCTATGTTNSEGKFKLERAMSNNGPVFVTALSSGSIGEKLYFELDSTDTEGKTIKVQQEKIDEKNAKTYSDYTNSAIFVDYYTEKEAKVTELQIDAKHFAGYYYVEASTLFRDEENGKDLPAEIVFPKVKVQSNFTFSMASTGDPSTFTFTMDALPAYTLFDKKKKVLCAMQVIEETVSEEENEAVTLMGYNSTTSTFIETAEALKDSKKNS
jgi:hypothetical protein